MKRLKNKNPNTSTNAEMNRMILNKVLANSVMGSRASYGGTKTFSGDRDIYTSLGYPTTIDYTEFYSKYLRQDIATAIIDKPVNGAWKYAPIIKTDGNQGDDSFNKAWEAIAKEFKLMNLFQRIDKLAGIGRYSTLYFGVQENEGSKVNEPLEQSNKLLYIQPYSEVNSPIKVIEMDHQSSRYGLPNNYGLRSAKIAGGQVDYNATVETNVHYSRVIHIADNLLENNIYGTPRLEKIYNRLLNLELIVGGSAEMFWQGAFPGLAFNVQEGFELDATDLANLDEEIKKYVHNMERYMKLNGIDVNNLSASVADPSSHVEVQLKMISIATGIPKRILEGSERGELASSQDTKAWNTYCDTRRKTFCENEILRPTIDKLISIGILQEPVGGEYIVEWPDLETTSDKDKAEVAKIMTDSLSSFTSNPNTQMIITPEAYLEEFMELEPDKVERIIEKMESQLKTMLDSEADGEETEEEDMELLKEEEIPLKN